MSTIDIQPRAAAARVVPSQKFATLREVAQKAQRLLSPDLWEWLDGAIEWGHTMRRNEEIFRQIALLPRVLRGADNIDSSLDFLGYQLSMPLIAAPTGHLTQFHMDGEAEVAAGIEHSGSVMCISTQTRLAMPEIRDRAPDCPWMFQVYFYGDRDWITNHVREAEALGATSICVCVDAPTRAYRYKDRENRYDARKYGRRTNPPVPAQHLNAQLSWDDMKWLRSITDKPFLIKGIMSPADALLAREAGADCVWLSNHGGRQLESDLTAVEMLPEVRDALGSDTKIVVDGGIRTGSDVVKCLALGADCVAIGRPVLHGLVADGAAGVARVMDLFQDEIRSAMGMSGMRSIAEITPDFVRTRF